MLESYSVSFKSEDEIGLLPLRKSIPESTLYYYIKWGILTLITIIIGGTLGTVVYIFYIK